MEDLFPWKSRIEDSQVSKRRLLGSSILITTKSSLSSAPLQHLIPSTHCISAIAAVLWEGRAIFRRWECEMLYIFLTYILTCSLYPHLERQRGRKSFMRSWQRRSGNSPFFALYLHPTKIFINEMSRRLGRRVNLNSGIVKKLMVHSPMGDIFH